MISMRCFEELQHNYTPEDTIMKSYLISILVACVEPIIIHGEGDDWDYDYQWTCVETTPQNLQIKAYQELPYTKTETVDLFNRSPIVEVSVE